MLSIKRNFVYNATLTVFNILFPIISFPYASRILGPVGIGQSQFVLTFAQYFVIFTALGLPIYGVREVAKVREDRPALSRLFSELVSINVMASFVVISCYLITILSVGKFKTNVNDYLLAGILIVMSFSNIDWFYSGLENFKQIATRSIAVKFVSLLALFVFVRTEKDTYTYIAISVFAILGNQLWNIITLRGKVQFSFVVSGIQRHVKPLFLTFGVLLAISLYTLFDTLLLGILSNDSAVGYYSAAIKLNRIALPLITALGTVLIPRMTVAIKDGNNIEVQRLFDRSFSFVSSLAIPVSIGIFIFAPELIYALAGKSFSNAILPMRIMSVLAVIVGIGHIFAVQILMPASKEKDYFIAVICGTACSLTLNFCLVPHLKEVGAAITNVATEIVAVGLSIYFVLRSFKLIVIWSQLYWSFLISLTFFLIAFLSRALSSNPIVVLAVAIPICSICYFSVRIFLLRDKMLLDIIKTLPFLERKKR